MLIIKDTFKRQEYRPYVVMFILGFILLPVLQYSAAFQRLAHYTAIHTLLESFSVIVSILIFAVGWNTKEYQKKPAIFIGISMLAAGALDLLHLLSYPGMPDFITPSSANKAISFWLLARAVTAVGLLLYIIRLSGNKELGYPRLTLLIGGVGVATVSGLILFYPQYIPTSYVAGSGLTTFKVVSEYTIALIFSVAAWKAYTMIKAGNHDRVYPSLLMISITFVVSELFFTLYNAPSDLMNLYGHLYKILGYFLLYKLLFKAALAEPYEALEYSEQKLKATLSTLPSIVFEMDKESCILRFHSSHQDAFFNSTLIGKKLTQELLEVKDFENALTKTKQAQDFNEIHIKQTLAGQTKYYDMMISRIGDVDTVHYVVVVHDVTDRYERVAALASEAMLNEGLLEMAKIQRQGRLSDLYDYALQQLKKMTNSVAASLHVFDSQSPNHNKSCSYGLDSLELPADMLEALRFSQVVQQPGSINHNDNQLALLGASALDDKGALKLVLLLAHEAEFASRDLDFIKIWVEYLWQLVGKLKLEQRSHVLSAAVEQNPHPILVASKDTKIEYVNEAFSELSGYQAQELVGQTPHMFSAGQTSGSVYRQMWQNLKAGKPWFGDLINQTKAGKRMVERTSIYPIKDSLGAVQHFISFQWDITQELENNEKIYQLSYYDKLTGLSNLTLFKYQFNKLRANLRRGALVVFGVDNFKTINNAYGLATGDDVLKRVAREIEHLKSKECLSARLSGDRFIVFSPAKREIEVAVVVEKLLSALKAPMTFNDNRVSITASAGVSLFPQDDDEVDGLIIKAESAMQQVKESGKNHFLFYERTMSSQTHRQLAIKNAILAGLRQGEFYFALQPQVNIKDTKVVGVELLLRWQSAILGSVSPAEFIPVAERFGLIKEIDHWVIENAFKMVKQWNEDQMPALTFAINLSAAMYEDKALIATLSDHFERYSIPSNTIELELTEGMALYNPDEALKTIDALKQLGCCLALDDFGTGYSSMSYLQKFNLDKIKIDKSFVDNLQGGSKRQQAIVKSIIDMASTLGMKSIAEGVENQLQWQLLTQLGCDEVQGYFFSKPVAVAEFYDLVSAAQANHENEST